MQLKDKSGIACDICGTTCQHDFKYYSFDIAQVDVYDNRKPPLQDILRLPVIFSVDVCTNCFEKYKTDIIKNYAKTMSKDRKPQLGITCELSGTKLFGTFTYYYVNVTYVNVLSSNQPQTCLRCKSTAINGKCTKCNSTDVMTRSAVQTTERFVEFNASEAEYNKFKHAAETVRRIASQWSTKS